MKKLKRILSIFMVVLLLISSAPVSGFVDTNWSDFKFSLPKVAKLVGESFGSEASAAYSLAQVMAVYGEGTYFTKSGLACTSTNGSCHNTHEECYLGSIPSRGGLPKGADALDADCWSCVGFAKYVLFCLHGVKYNASDYVVTNSPQTGDLMIKSGHWGIYNNGRMYSSNYSYAAGGEKGGIVHLSSSFKASDYTFYRYKGSPSSYQIDVNPIIDGQVYMSGKDGFTFGINVGNAQNKGDDSGNSVWVDPVIDFCRSFTDGTPYYIANFQCPDGYRYAGPDHFEGWVNGDKVEITPEYVKDVSFWGISKLGDNQTEVYKDESAPSLKGQFKYWFYKENNGISDSVDVYIDGKKVSSQGHFEESRWYSYTVNTNTLSNGSHKLEFTYYYKSQKYSIKKEFYSKKAISWNGVTNADGNSGYDMANNPTLSGIKRFWVDDNNTTKDRYAKMWIDNTLIASNAKTILWANGKNYFDCTVDTGKWSNGKHTFYLYLYENGIKTAEVKEEFTINNPISWWGITDDNYYSNHNFDQKPTLSKSKCFWINDLSTTAGSYINVLVDDVIVAENIKSENWQNSGTNYFYYILDTTKLSNGDHKLKAVLYQKDQIYCTLEKDFVASNDFYYWGITDGISGEARNNHEDKSFYPTLSGNRAIWYGVPKSNTLCTYYIAIDGVNVVSDKQYDNSGWIAYETDFSKFKNGKHEVSITLYKDNEVKTITNNIKIENDFYWWGLTDGVTGEARNRNVDNSFCPTLIGSRAIWYHAPSNINDIKIDVFIDGEINIEGSIDYEKSGWIYYIIDSTKLENGSHTITMIAHTASGDKKITNNFVVENHVHEYEGFVTLLPTCNSKGTETYICSCGDSYEEDLLTLEHTYDNYCDTTCNICGETRTTSHTSDFGTVTKVPTCVTNGEKIFRCTLCDAIIKTTVVSATGHKNTYDTDGVDATCTENGISPGTVCKDCGTVISGQEVIKATGHKEVVYSEMIPPTCTADGHTAETRCINCGIVMTKSKVIPATAHTDNNKDGICDECGTEIKIDNPSANCSCNCHKSGFMSFIWKIINFFNKLFRNNPVCDCGAKHY